MHLLRGGNDGGVALKTMEIMYGLSKDNITNYIHYVGWGLY